ncbi:EKC/KEOPS complex subunit CGI121/TPRKB [Geosmithia morbida]|uniref:EKC/KEOPS complex subunit CGI121 n=1 Tax=Geosmithia morbida TaxID=1094350 RepID=A0A9P4YZW0_9HYPO|nr:EKC/KEOPS complex subunit CGI121/TPRKB [Geosmithia morbida]KAF4124839.1 EKC/KEOPS complex subunit CGI121/TPRKB [Geosmithia morbida]
MSLETVVLDHLPTHYAVHLALFRDVRNATFLHSQLLALNLDFEYGLVDASVIVSRQHLLAAVFKAVTSSATDTLKTPNVHSEIVASLSPSKNIAEAYRRFGISPNTKDLIVVKVIKDDSLSAEKISAHLASHVEGSWVPVTDEGIAAATNMTKILKYYKLNGLNWMNSIKDTKAKHKEIEMLVLGAMALHGV